MLYSTYNTDVQAHVNVLYNLQSEKPFPKKKIAAENGKLFFPLTARYQEKVVYSLFYFSFPQMNRTVT